jgi:AcrR family transcriptional regulator
VDTETNSNVFRERILDATERLLATFGYRKMTMEDIAREAGVGRRTIYLHFPGKEEVALSSIDRVVQRLLARLRQEAALPKPPADQLHAMLILRVMFRFDSVRDYYQSFTEMFAAIRPAYLARRETYFAAEARIFADVLRAGREAGDFQFEDAPAAAQTLLLATNALLPFSLSARELGSRAEVETKAGAIADLLLRGLLTRQHSLPASEPLRPKEDNQ